MSAGRSTGLRLAALAATVVALLLTVGGSSAYATIVFTKGPETGAAPPKLGPYTMQPFTLSGASNSERSEVPGPTGTVMLSPEMDFVEFGFANGTTGWMFGPAADTLTLPANTGAFYLYAGWGCTDCGGGPGGGPGTVSVTAVAQDGTSSGALAVPERPSGEYFGFYAECGSSLKSVALTVTGTKFTPPLAIGAFAIAPTSANSNCPTAGAPIPEASPTEVPPTEQEAFESISSCPAATTPETNLTTPTPPPPPEEVIAARFGNAHVAEIAQPPGAPPALCSYRAKYTKAEKDAAHEWSVYYADQSANDAIIAGTAGLIAASATAIPEPLLSKTLALGNGAVSGLASLYSAYYSKQANYMAALEHDPPDPNWRTTAAPPGTHPRRLPAIHGLRRRQQGKVNAYLTAILHGTADSECVEEAINRASTALANKDTAAAAVQYKAGAACAAANVSIAKRLPKLSAAAKPAMVKLTRPLGGSAVKRYLAKHLAADERKAALRTKSATRIVASLERLVALPSSTVTELQAALAKPASVSALTPSKLLRAMFPSSKLDAAWRTLQEQTAQVLAAAAAR